MVNLDDEINTAFNDSEFHYVDEDYDNIQPGEKQVEDLIHALEDQDTDEQCPAGNSSSVSTAKRNQNYATTKRTGLTEKELIDFLYQNQVVK